MIRNALYEIRRNAVQEVGTYLLDKYMWSRKGSCKPRVPRTKCPIIYLNGGGEYTKVLTRQPTRSTPMLPNPLFDLYQEASLMKVYECDRAL